MLSKPYNWLILLFTFTIIILVISQVFLLKKVYNVRIKEFNSNVVKSIRGIYEEMDLIDTKSFQLQELIEQPDDNSFLFKINAIPVADSLVTEAAKILEEFSIFTPCYIAVYESNKNSIVQNHFIPSAANELEGDGYFESPVVKKDYNYILLVFPNRKGFLFSSLQWWIISSTLLVLVLVALGITNFQLYRQKFLNEIQNDFIRNVTHEFQTPLTTLLVGLDILSKPGIVNQPEKLAKYTGLMQGQTFYLKQHIENMVRVMQADSRGIPLKKEWVAPNELVKEAVAQLNQTIEECGAEIKLNLEPSNEEIKAEKGSILIAIINLITNAIKYSQQPLVEISTGVSDASYLISVKDNGSGIAKKVQKNLFQKFYRVPTGDVHNVRGLGLGLYFVKKAMKNHNGSISVVSEVDQGSTFTLEIPRSKGKV